MREIEKQMIQACLKGKNWSCANTQVVVTDDPDCTHRCAVFLHGNHIADVRTFWGVMQELRPEDVIPNYDTFRAWPTATTRSRLRALGVNAYIKNREAHIA